MDVSDDTLELLERRLGERVERRARTRLVAIYGLVGSIIMGVLGFFGYDLVDGARTKVDAAVAGIEEDAKRYAREAVADSVERAEEAAARADDLARRSSAKLEVLDEWQTQRELALSNNEQRVTSAQARVDQMADQIETRLGAIVEKLKETEAQLTAQNERAKDLAGIGNVAELANNVAALTRQVQALDDQLREVREKSPTGLTYEAPSADRAEIDAVLRDSVAQAAPPLTPTRASGSAVVYFQFAGVKREEAEAISRRLATLGYTMPGEERTGSAAGLHEIRYFFAQDKWRADGLAGDINRVLAAAGYKADVEVQDSTSYRGTKPTPGTIELWLEPVRAR